MLTPVDADAPPAAPPASAGRGAARRFTALFALALAALLGIALATYANVRELRRSAALVAHTHQVRGALDALLARLTEAESAQRGYLLTGDGAELVVYRDASADLRRTIAAVRDTTRDNARQQAHLDTLEPLVAERLHLLGERLALGRVPAEHPRQLALVARGSALTRSIEARAHAMQAEEGRLLERRAGAVHLSERSASLALLVGALTSMGLAAVAFRALRRELRERARAELELRDSEQRFRRLAEASPDAVCISVDGRVVDVNAAFARLFGVDAAEVRGRHVATLVAASGHDEVAARVDANVEGEYELVGMRADGSTFPMSVNARRSAYGGLPARVTVLRDLSERQAIDRMKSEFVSVVSHELRTPLTSIRGSLGLVEGGAAGALPPRAAELVRIARANTERLVRLINDILDVEKIEAGKLELRLATVDVADLVAATVAEVEGMAVQADVRLAVADGIAGRVHGDRDRLVQVLTNLLSNAVKFSRAGGTVRVSASGDETAVRVTVEDAGPGIPAEHLPRLFQRFAQLDASDRRARSGTGLGLAISKAIVAHHGGTIGVESEPHVRTAFWFELPRLVEAAPPAPAAARDDRPRVLVVEDDGAVREALAGLLEPAGYAIDGAGTLADARARVRDAHYAAVLLDLGLPDGDGLELVRELRERPDLGDVPIVVVSGREPDGTFQRPQLVDWITKPLDTDRVRRALHAALRRPGPARVLVVDDDASARAVVAARLRTLDVQVMEAGDGREALARCREHAPDVIVLDVGMPRMDGFEFVALLRDGGLPAPPLVVYTGRDLNAAERRSLSLGVTRHLTKARASEAQFVASVLELLGGLAAPHESGTGRAA